MKRKLQRLCGLDCVLSASFLLVFGLSRPQSEAATSVGGLIFSNTVWRIEGSPYSLTTNVEVGPNATLTIEPGCSVTGGGIYVFGSLLSVGTPDALISYQQAGIVRSSATAACSLRFCYFRSGGAQDIAQIEDCTFRDSGSYLGGNPGLPPIFRRNTVFHAANPSLPSLPGLGVFQGPKAEIRANIVIGYLIYGNGPMNVVVADNLLIASQLQFSCDAVVTNNVFIGTNIPAIKLVDYGDVVAVRNYWGTTNLSIVSEMIYDRADSFYPQRYVSYIPVLDAPPAAVPILPLPVILTQPDSQTVSLGSNVVIRVVAQGVGRLQYQWRKNGLLLLNATNSTLSLTNVSGGQSGSFAVDVANLLGGTTTSEAAVLTVQNCPLLLQQPISQTVSLGGSVELSVSAAGAAPFTYQWLFKNQPLVGATMPSLTISNITANQVGVYTVRVTDAANGVSSASATVSLLKLDVLPVLTLEGQTNSTCLIEFAESPNGPWQVLNTVKPSNAHQLFVDETAPPSAKRFYRVYVSP